MHILLQIAQKSERKRAKTTRYRVLCKVYGFYVSVCGAHIYSQYMENVYSCVPCAALT